MTKDEALCLALKSLERSVATCLDPYSHEQVKSRPEHFINQAITALRLVIDVENMASESTYKEQLETKDEFVAWEQFYPDMGKPQIAFNAEVVGYVAPQRTWVWLTDKEVDECLQGLPTQTIDVYARRIETKIKEKNT
jgi:hypothetical protein